MTVYHYDLFSRTVCYVYRRPWADERSFVSVQQRALPTVQCSRRHKFAIHHCCATLNIFIQLAVTCNFNSTHRMHCCVPTAITVTRTRHNITLYVLYIAFFALLRRVREKWQSESSCLCVCPSVRPPTWNNSTPTGRVFMKYDIWIFFRKSA